MMGAYFQIPIKNYKLNLWQRVRLFFQKMRYSSGHAEKYVEVIGWKEIDGILVILEERRIYQEDTP